jgi:hypothetical protein
MNPPAVIAYFFDTSALMARFLRRGPGYAWVNAICAPELGAALALAEITKVELTSALYQMSRGGTLKAKRRDASLDLFWNQIDSGEYAITRITPAIIESATDLCKRHPLKGYDAIQLACALVFREDLNTIAPTPAGLVFLSEDTKLLKAAAAEGFTVDNPVMHTS